MTLNYLYLLAAILFILGIKDLTRIKTARRGNLVSSAGMLLAVATTLLEMQGKIGWLYILIGILIGTIIGWVMAIKVKMTSMPEMVAIFNGFGGAASVLVALSYFLINRQLPQLDLLTVLLSVLIGSITFTGSVIAFAKLAGYIKARPIVFPGNNLLNLFMGILLLGLGAIILLSPLTPWMLTLMMALMALSLVLGLLLVIPIGGADMPVVIALLNSYSGLAAAATGFVLKNPLLIVAGALVGASGIILTQIMCKAMNRSLKNVLFGGFGQEVAKSSQETGYSNIKQTSAEEAAMMLDGAESVIFVPGYGLAVAQAQFAVQEIAEFLKKKGKKVSFAIHPVAGRMPGHMNVLLAEANVPYEMLKEMDSINPEFKNTDVAIVIGANDVVNPAASQDKTSPIYGMPILKVHEAKTAIVIKRTLGSGFAAIENRLFDLPNTLMLFGDAKDVLQKVMAELEEM